MVSNNCDFDLFWYCRVNFVPMYASLSYCRTCILFFLTYQVHKSTECFFDLVDYDELSDYSMETSTIYYCEVPFYTKFIYWHRVDFVIDFYQDIPFYLSLLVLFFLELHKLDKTVLYILLVFPVDTILLV